MVFPLRLAAMKTPVCGAAQLYAIALADTMTANRRPGHSARRFDRFMSPYLWFALAMAAIVVLSLVVTGNLASTFNERAKSDLKAALEPLAAPIDGSVSVEEASVSGRYHGQITSGQMISGPGGMGRLFQTTFVEPSGGTAWKAVVRRPKDAAEDWDRTFDGSIPIADQITTLLDDLLPYPGWFELNYDPDSGTLKLTRAMQSRRDLPTPERFLKYLDTLEQAATINREIQTA
jgi:hypothetical protein